MKSIDWKELEEKYASQASAARGPCEFSKAIVPLLAELKDIHVWIALPDGTRLPTHRSGFVPNYNLEFVRQRLSSRTPKVNQSDSTAPVRVPILDFGSLGFTGRIDNLGYVAITSLPVDGRYDEMVRAILNMNEARGIIVDLRRNSGGSETRAAKIAGCFAAQRTKYARTMLVNDEGQLFESSSRYLQPSPKNLANLPIACMIGPGCVSSGEGLALMMKALPNVTVVGQPTRGSSGNPSPVHLSNGVDVWFSRWVSLELDGAPIEGRGVTPDVTVEHQLSKDPTLEKAIELLRPSDGSTR